MFRFSARKSVRSTTISPSSENNILLIDGDPMSLRLWETYLSNGGFKVLCALDSNNLLDMILEPSNNIRLIIVDLNKNTMGSIAFIESLRKTLFLNTPIIATASDLSLKQVAHSAGANLFFLRPLNGVELVQTIKTLITTTVESREEQISDKCKVMIVDDSLVVVKVFSKFLTEMGYLVHGTEDAHSAFELITSDTERSVTCKKILHSIPRTILALRNLTMIVFTIQGF